MFMDGIRGRGFERSWRLLQSRLETVGRWLADLYARMDRARTLGLAAETAFWLFLSLLPLAAVAGLVAARLTTNNWDHFSPLLNRLPVAARDLIASELIKVASWHGGTVGLTGTVIFVWLASSGIHAIFDALEIETGATRPWWKKRLLAMGTCVGLSLAVAILAILGPGLEGALGWLGRGFPPFANLGPPTPIGRLVRFVLGCSTMFAYVCALYWVGVPPEARRRMPIVPGAIITVVLHASLSFAYATYLSKVGNGTTYSAGLAIIGVTLTALYLFAVALLTGAMVNRKLGAPAPRSHS
jgi:membrane protein